MFTNLRNPALAVAVLLVSSATGVYAQGPVGTRARGMAGAFTAVADDASAVYWNPAGIATGAFVSAVVDLGQSETSREIPQHQSDERDRTMFVGVAATAVGLAYYRYPTYGTGSVAPAVTGLPRREEVGHSVHAVSTSVAGVSLLQSITEHLVVGVTPKFMTGAEVHGSSDNAFDVDAGAMFYRNGIRVGVVGRNLTAPAFVTSPSVGKSSDADPVRLQREVRAGAAWGSGWTGISRVIVSADADLITRITPSGDRRDVAGGLETWWMQQRLGLRGGLSRSTIGDARAAYAAGISAGLKQGMLLEAHVVRGHRAERSWSVGARMTF